MKNKDKTKETKKKTIEYFTDEMHKTIFAFPDTYRQTKSGKAVMNPIKFGTFKK